MTLHQSAGKKNLLCVSEQTVILEVRATSIGNDIWFDTEAIKDGLIMYTRAPVAPVYRYVQILPNYTVPVHNV